MTLPPPWAFLLGVLAAWRIWKLLAVDDILDYWNVRDKLMPPDSKRRDFLDCPYCAGFWISLGGTAGWYVVEGWDTYGFLVTVFAMSAVVVFIEILLDLTVAKKDAAEDDA